MPLDLDREPSAAQLRWFGPVVLVVFGAIGSVLTWRFESFQAAFLAWALGLVVVIPYYLVPRLRAPIFRAWMYLTMPIGWSVSHLLLGFVYFVVVAPIGAAQRRFGRDALGRRFDASTPSYWKARNPANGADRYFHQT